MSSLATGPFRRGARFGNGGHVNINTLLSRDGPLVKFVVTNYRAILLLMVTGIAINTIRMGISSLDIGVRTGNDNHTNSPRKYPSSADTGSSSNLRLSELSSSEDLASSTTGSSSNIFSTHPITRNTNEAGKGTSDKRNLPSSSSTQNEQPIITSSVTDGGLAGGLLDWDALERESNQNIMDDAASQVKHHRHDAGKISSAAAMGLGSFQIPQNQQQPLPPQQIPGVDSGAAPPLVGGRKNVMVIGGMGFIGFHTCLHLKQLGHLVVSFDVQTDTPLNADKLHILQNFHNIPTIQGDACDSTKLYSTLEHFQITHVIYLASQSYERGHVSANNNHNVSYIEEGNLGTIPSDEGGNIIVDLTPAELDGGEETLSEAGGDVTQDDNEEEDDDNDEDADLDDRDEDEADNDDAGDDESEEDGAELTDEDDVKEEDDNNDDGDKNDLDNDDEEKESAKGGDDENELPEVTDEDESIKDVDEQDESDNETQSNEEGVSSNRLLRGIRRLLTMTETEDASVNISEEDSTATSNLREEGNDGSNTGGGSSRSGGGSSFSFSSLPSPTHGFEYPPNNLDCFATLLDIVRRVDLHVVYASSSHGYQFQDRGVYQFNAASSATTTSANAVKTATSVQNISEEEIPHPSLYHPKSKRTNELMAEAYSLLYDISSVGIRFPTTYGPFGRPNFTYYQFMRAVGSSLSPVTEPAGDDKNEDSSTIQIPYIKTRDNIDKIVKQEQQLSLIHVDDVVKNLVAALDLTQEGAMILTVGRACATPATSVIQMMEQSLKTIREQQQLLQQQQEQQIQNGQRPAIVNNQDTIDSEYAHSEQLIDRSMDPQAQHQESTETSDGNLVDDSNPSGSNNATSITGSEPLLDESNAANSSLEAASTIIEYVDVTQEPFMSISPIFANMTSTRCREGKTHGEIALSEGIHALMYWYEMEGGKERDRVLLQNPEEEVSDGMDVSTPIGENMESFVNEQRKARSGPPTDICHVTASFAEDENKADKVPSVAHLSHEHPNRYFFFTNLPNLECDGWERVVLKEMPFRRFITQSRWPKFMGWLHPALKDCKALFYADAIWRPQDLPMTEWDMLANITLASDAGILQQIRPFNHSGMRELNFIKSHRKDIKRNVAASREWFLSQPDFNNTSLSYRNNAFVYDPHNPNFRLLMTAFWTHYSQEEDSWRDQPLYRYLVNKLQLTPALYPKYQTKTVKKNGQVRDYWEEKGKKGYNGHHYKDKDDANAGAKVQR